MLTMLTIVLTILTFYVPHISSYDKEITINVDPGKIDCFYHHAKIGDTIDIEYQVIDGGHGDLDISFELAEPTGRTIFGDFKKPENVHRHVVIVEGDYRFCFDNRFSTFNKKTIFFELIIENEEESSKNSWKEDILEGLTPDEFYDVKVQDILDYIGRIRNQISKARQIQDQLKSFEARDRNIAEQNYFKVNAWSMFQIAAMLCVGSLQVFMVKSIFFTNESKMHLFWKKIGL